MRKASLLLILLLCGCGMLPITDAQIESVSSTAGRVAEEVAAPVIKEKVPEEISSLFEELFGFSLAGGSGIATTIISMWALKKLQKKNKKEREKEIREIVNESATI